MNFKNLWEIIRSFALPDDLQVKIIHRKDGVDEHYHIKPHQDPTDGLKYLRDAKEVGSWSDHPVAGAVTPMDMASVSLMSHLAAQAGDDFSPENWKNPTGQGERKISQVTDPKTLEEIQEGLKVRDKGFQLKLLSAYDVDYADPEFEQTKKLLKGSKMMYHAASNTRAASVVATGLKLSNDVGSVTGQMFGNGIYLAKDPEKSAQYLGEKTWYRHQIEGPQTDEGVLFQMEAVLGKNPYQAATSMDGLYHFDPKKGGGVLDMAADEDQYRAMYPSMREAWERGNPSSLVGLIDMAQEMNSVTKDKYGQVVYSPRNYGSFRSDGIYAGDELKKYQPDSRRVTEGIQRKIAELVDAEDGETRDILKELFSGVEVSHHRSEYIPKEIRGSMGSDDHRTDRPVGVYYKWLVDGKNVLLPHQVAFARAKDKYTLSTPDPSGTGPGIKTPLGEKVTTVGNKLRYHAMDLGIEDMERQFREQNGPEFAEQYKKDTEPRLDENKLNLIRTTDRYTSVHALSKHSGGGLDYTEDVVYHPSQLKLRRILHVARIPKGGKK